jgi:hypothetical protein
MRLKGHYEHKRDRLESFPMLIAMGLIFLGVAVVVVLTLSAIPTGSFDLRGGARRDGRVAAPGARAPFGDS